MEESNQQPDNGTPQSQPGQVIVPGGSQAAVPQYPEQQNNPIVYTAVPEEDFQRPEDESTFDESDTDAISWSASEFIAHEKNNSWFINVIVAGVGVASVMFLITRSFLSAGVILFMFVVFAVYGARQPRQLPYRLNKQGLQIGTKFSPYVDFKSFSVVPEGAFSSIVFAPMKRFSPLTTIYYAPEDEERIIALLISHLPYEERKQDPVDKLMQRIRF